MVGEEGTLRLPGRPRGVDGVDQVVGPNLAYRVSLVFARIVIIEEDRAPVSGRQALRQRSLCHQDRCVGVLEHERDPVGRVVEVDGQVCPPGLENAEKTHDEVQAALSTESDEGFRPDAGALEPVGQSIRAAVEFRIGERHAIADKRLSVRLCVNLCLEPAMDGKSWWKPDGYRKAGALE